MKKNNNKKAVSIADISIDNVAVVALVAYVMVAIVSDIASSRVMLIGGAVVDAGVLLIPMSFTIRDLLHEKIGVKNALKIVWATAFINLLVALFLFIVSFIPSMNAEFDNAWNAVIGCSMRIIVGSFVAQLASDTIDTLVFERCMHKFGNKKIWLRVILSNALSIPVDSIVCTLIAFGGLYSPQQLCSVVVVNIAMKFAVSALSMPLAYAGKNS